MNSLVEISRRLSRQVSRLSFSPPITHVYNPLDYARAPGEIYLERYGNGPKKILFLGMNPGPFGMAQTGIPFGDVGRVRDWLKIQAPVLAPDKIHPRRPVEGFQCRRAEISGSRFWTWIEKEFGRPEAFFSQHFVWNYCPLAFMEASGKNRTPNQIPKPERALLEKFCQQALAELTKVLAIDTVIALGRYAEQQARVAIHQKGMNFSYLLHPSPMSPSANHDWDRRASELLDSLR